MLRQALIALALAFAATTLHGCGGLQKAAEATKFLKSECDSLGSKIDDMEVTTPEDCPQEEHVKKGVTDLVKAKWIALCFANVSADEGHAMMSFNKSDNDYAERVQQFSDSNTDKIQKGYQEKLNDACAHASHAGSVASNVSAAASAKADEAKAAASSKADEAMAAASSKADEAKEAASSKADEAKAAISAKADKAKKHIEDKVGGGSDDEAKDSSDSDDKKSSDTKLFEVVRDADGEKGKSASTSFVVLAEAGMGLAVLGVVVSVRLASRQRTSSEGIQFVGSEAEIE